MPDPLIPILENIAAELRRREAPGEVVPLRVEELPDLEADYLPCLWLDSDGRPHPAVTFQHNGRVNARLAYHERGDGTRYSLGGRDVVVYPESAAPALWERFLGRQVGRVG